MKKILILTTALTLSATAFAFGGGGSGRKSTAFTSGVDAIGVHMNGKTCPAGQELYDNECVEKCDSQFLHNTDGSCTVCTNGNVYLSYMPEFGIGPCDTETPMNEVISDCPCTNSDGKCISYEYDIDWNCTCAASDAKPCKSNKITNIIQIFL